MTTRRRAGRSTPVGATLLALALALAAAVFATADTVSAPLAPTPADGAPAPSLLSPSSPVRVLAVPLVAARSHLFVMWAVVEELAVRGNEVAVLIVEQDVPAAASLLAKAPPAAAARISLVPYKDAAPAGWWGSYLTTQASGGGAPSLGAGHVRAWVAQTDALLSDAGLVAALRAWRPHSVLGDTVFLATPGLAAALGVPFTTLSCTGPIDPVHADLLGLENDLRTIPQFGTGLGLPLGWEGMAANVATWLAGKAFFRWVWHTIWQPVAIKHNIPLLGTPASIPQELGHIFNGDFAFEWPRSVPSKVHFVGHILAGNTTVAIPADLQAILDAAPDGVILVSFGTSLRLDPSIYRTVAAGLAALTPPVTVIWKLGPVDLGGRSPDAVFGGPLPRHITLVPWAPQNALLQTGRVAALLNHGGSNSVYEAAFHGVPQACVPFFGDGVDTTAKAVSRGMAVGLGKPRDLTPARIAGGLATVLADPAYRASARGVGARLRARPGGPARGLAADIVVRETQDWWAVRELRAAAAPRGGDDVRVE